MIPLLTADLLPVPALGALFGQIVPIFTPPLFFSAFCETVVWRRRLHDLRGGVGGFVESFGLWEMWRRRRGGGGEGGDRIAFREGEGRSSNNNKATHEETFLNYIN